MCSTLSHKIFSIRNAWGLHNSVIEIAYVRFHRLVMADLILFCVAPCAALWTARWWEIARKAAIFINESFKQSHIHLTNCKIAGLAKHIRHILTPPPKTQNRCPFYNVRTTLTSPWLILRSTIAKLIILAPFLFLAIWRIFALFSISSLCPGLYLLLYFLLVPPFPIRPSLFDVARHTVPPFISPLSSSRPLHRFPWNHCVAHSPALPPFHKALKLLIHFVIRFHTGLIKQTELHPPFWEEVLV